MKTTPTNQTSAEAQNITDRDGCAESMWQTLAITTPVEDAYKLDSVYDALIIGGGITGLTAALQLQTAGKSCLLADAHSVGYGTTGGTSAHINTFADTSYSEAKSAFGQEGAQLFADAVNEGAAIIKNNVDTYSINCDYEAKTGYIYAEDDEQAKQLDDVYEGTKNVGVEVEYTQNVPTPLLYKKALVLPNQAQFHPLKYLQGLQNAFLQAGGIILEDTRITGITTEDGIHTAATATETSIKAKSVIYATHTIPGINVFSFKCAPYRSYVVAVTLKDEAYPDALVYDMQEPYHYIRTHQVDGQKYLLVGGNDHKTGHDDPEAAFADLEEYTRFNYQVDSFAYRWSSQYYVPVDGLPYIGHYPGKGDNIYCATGYNGNGMMLGTIAGKIMADLILGNASKYADVFSPARLKPISGFTEFVKENADVAYHFVADRLSIKETDSLKDLQNDSGKVVEVDGKKIAAYRDSDGEVHALNPVCTHAHCIVSWNQEERSWDCPCHGARFDIDGTVLTGPADMDLQKIEFE